MRDETFSPRCHLLMEFQAWVLASEHYGKAPAKEGSAEEQSDGANSTIPREET